MDTDIMSYYGAKDLNLEIPAGRIDGVSSVNKFGRAPSGVQVTATDIWDRANATPTQQIWVAPTTARIHDIVSTSINDDGSPVGTGARTLRVYGLTAWNADETSEDITLDGTSNVATANSYVIIHRMRVLTFGSSGPNVGTITATAQTDGTVTAQINIGEGQTQMAIYGVPSTKTAYMTEYYAAIHEAGGTPSTAEAVDISLYINPIPDSELAGFLVKHTLGVATTGTTYFNHTFKPYFKITGPAIIKMQGLGSGADLDTSAGFDLILEDV
jgi:hypothetical protein